MYQKSDFVPQEEPVNTFVTDMLPTQESSSIISSGSVEQKEAIPVDSGTSINTGDLVGSTEEIQSVSYTGEKVVAPETKVFSDVTVAEEVASGAIVTPSQ